ncbi:MAG: hypothetical protein R3A52_28360 [Polyangiales bacterium]
MSELSRRAFVTAALAALAGRSARAAVRVPSGGALRLPLHATRRVLDPALAVDHADVAPLALTHDWLARFTAAGVDHPMLVEPPIVERAGRAAAARLVLRPGMRFSDGAPVDAAAVARAWTLARASSSGRLALALLDTGAPVTVRAPLELVVRLHDAARVDDFLAAPPMAVAGRAARGARAGVGAFSPRANPGALGRNDLCPTGAAWLDGLTLSAPTARNEEIRRFTTQALDASWWGASLYELSRPAQRVVGAGGPVVGLVPELSSALATAPAARGLERLLADLHGEGGPLLPMGLAPGDVSAALSSARLNDLLAARPGNLRSTLRVGRDPGDGALVDLAERIVATLDRAGVRAAIVDPPAACDVSLRAVTPVAADASFALASLLAASGVGDQSGAEGIMRGGGSGYAAAVWGRSVVAVLGRRAPVIYLREGVAGARFDPLGRLSLCDAWVRG